MPFKQLIREGLSQVRPACLLLCAFWLVAWPVEPIFAQKKIAQEQTSTEEKIILPDTAKWTSVKRDEEVVAYLSSLELTKPRPVKLVVLRVRLDRAFELVITPDNGEQKLETNGLKTSTFLAKHHVDFAINAAPFHPVSLFENQPHDIRGLQISDGNLVSKPDPSTPVLLFDESHQPTIEGKPPAELGKIKHAVAGFHVVLKSGKPMGNKQPLHPRTAVGISKAKNEMIWLVVDGRQKGKSEGVSTMELGHMLKQLGCESGINLDGGGTSTLVQRGKDGKPAVLNTPIHAGVPGLERSSASHLGIRFSKSK